MSERARAVSARCLFPQPPVLMGKVQISSASQFMTHFQLGRPTYCTRFSAGKRVVIVICIGMGAQNKAQRCTFRCNAAAAALLPLHDTCHRAVPFAFGAFRRSNRTGPFAVGLVNACGNLVFPVAPESSVARARPPDDRHSRHRSMAMIMTMTMMMMMVLAVSCMQFSA